MTSVYKESVSEKDDLTLRDVVGILELTNQKIDGISTAVLTINRRADSLEVRMGSMERNQEKLRGGIADMQDDLTTALAALDTDSLKVLDHEQRIRRLEKSEA